MYHKTYTESDWIWHWSFRFVNVDMKQNRGWDPICCAPMVFGQDGLNLWNQESFPKQPQLMSTVFYPQKCMFDCLFLPSQQWATCPHRHAMASHRRYLVLWFNSACPELGLSTIWWRLWCIPRWGSQLRCGPQTLQLPWLCVQAMVTVSTMRPTMAVLKRTRMRWSKSGWKPHWNCARDCQAWI